MDQKNNNKKLEKTKKKDKTKFIENYSGKNMIVYLVLRILVILTLIRQVMLGNWNNVFLCILTLVLFAVPIFIDKRLNITLPDVLQIIILLFIYSAEILGEINEFYLVINHWDTILHTINGFLCAAIGFSLIDILNRKEFFHATMSAAFVGLVAFCFSMSVGIMWEFFEYNVDNLMNKDMQKDTIISKISSVNLNPDGKNNPVTLNNIEKTIIITKDDDGNETQTVIEGGYLDVGLHDTMQDLIVNFIGALVFSIIGCLYLKNKDEYKFAENFIPTMKKST